MAFFTTERRGRIAVVTFDRPPRNLMSMAAMGELEVALGELAADDDINVVMITGGVPGSTSDEISLLMGRGAS